MLDRNEIEILQVALGHEERARTFYERLAAGHRGTAAGELFAFLAAEEEGHIAKISAVHGIPRFEASWEIDRLPAPIDLDELAWAEGIAAGAAAGADAVRRGLEIAAKAEGAAVEFYARAGGTADGRETKALLSQLEAEERIHLAKIERYLKELEGQSG